MGMEAVRKFGVLVLGVGLAGVVVADNDVARLDSILMASSDTLNGKKAVVYYFGGDNDNYCTATITQDFFTRSKGHMKNQYGNQSEFTVDCNWRGKYYVLSNKAETYSNMELTNGSELTLVAELVSPSGDTLAITTPAPILLPAS